MRFEKDTRRALRRHHRQRMVRKAYNLAMSWWYSYGLYTYAGEQRAHGELLNEYAKWALDYARQTHSHLAVCSCYMCGNPRRHYGQVTRQEVRALVGERQQLAEFDMPDNRVSEY